MHALAQKHKLSSRRGRNGWLIALVMLLALSSCGAPYTFGRMVKGASAMP
jgi:hypothetical protein